MCTSGPLAPTPLLPFLALKPSWFHSRYHHLLCQKAQAKSRLASSQRNQKRKGTLQYNAKCVTIARVWCLEINLYWLIPRDVCKNVQPEIMGFLSLLFQLEIDLTTIFKCLIMNWGLCVYVLSFGCYLLTSYIFSTFIDSYFGYMHSW